MKKFCFSLQKVLEIKEQGLENLKIELSNLNYSLRNVEMQIESLYNKYYEMNVEFNQKTAKSISVGEMSYYKICMNSFLKQIENKEDEKFILNKKIEAKTREIVEQNTEISSIEKLKEKEIEKYRKAVIKSEEIFIEEFVSNKSLSKKIAI